MNLTLTSEAPDISEEKPKAPRRSLQAPSSLKDLGLSEIFLAQLMLKHCFYLDVFTLKDLAERLKVHSAILNQVIDYLVQEKCVEIRGADPRQTSGTMFGLSNRHALTEEGKRRASQLIEYDGYVGPVPVALEHYWRQVEAQSIRAAEPGMDDLRRAFKGLVIPPDILEQLGPCLLSGKSLFLYGPSGNGKTSIALRLAQVWDDGVLIPYAIYVDGHVIRIFDEINHQPLAETVQASESGDRRWVLCHRPCIVVGGELNLEMLDLTFNSSLKYYGAPLQLKANNGIFVVDDFGRQQVSPHLLLNRWILPLENRQDFLYLSTGQKFGIPFDQLLVFATNLEPQKLMDPAFLRRVRAKIKVRNADRLQFKEIFRLTCEHHQIAYNEEVVEHLLTEHYDMVNRPMSACHPRDFVEQILDYCRFHKMPPLLTRENLDRVCRVYFV